MTFNFHVLSFPCVTAKPVSLQAFNSTSEFISIALIPSLVTTYSDIFVCHNINNNTLQVKNEKSMLIEVSPDAKDV